TQLSVVRSRLFCCVDCCSYSDIFFFFLNNRLPPISTLFPYTTLFRSGIQRDKLVSDLQSKIRQVWNKSFTIHTVGFGSNHDYDLDRKSTRLNSSHGSISYAVFCLKKKKKKHEHFSNLSINHHTLSSPI